jgi:Domain of unknown function (DUF4398)
VRANCRSVACLLALLAAGCGPVRATSVIGDAEAAVARARAAGSEKAAPYETVSAELYLTKAREQQGRAQYGAAEDLAKQSLRFAQEAIERAGQAPNRAPVPASASPASITRSQPAPGESATTRSQ